MQLTTEAPDAATGRVRFVPTLNAGSGEVMGFHRHLLADRVRTGAFVEAVRRAVRPGDFVVDLGAGTGVLAVAAAQEGAGTVIGVERTAVAARARALAAANGVRVTVVQGESDHVRLPRLADVLVSECLGLAGLGGAMIGAVKRARDRWLKPGGLVIPKRVRVFAAPVEDSEADALVHCWDGARVAGVRLDVLGAHVGHNLYIASFTDRHLLARPVAVCGADLQAGPLEDAVTGTVTATATRPGTLHGWALWFEADLAGDSRAPHRPSRCADGVGAVLRPGPRPPGRGGHAHRPHRPVPRPPRRPRSPAPRCRGRVDRLGHHHRRQRAPRQHRAQPRSPGGIHRTYRPP